MYRERLTITLDSALLQSIDSLIDGERLRNRSQTIEHLLREGVGLHQLTQAFIFVDEATNPSAVAAIADLCAATEIRRFYLCLSQALRAREAELSALIHERYAAAKRTCEVTAVPADFGSGGSLVLQKDALTTPFLVAWPTAQALPQSLIPAFLFHRSHHGLLTDLCAAQESGYASSGLYIASPELVGRIPAGASNLQKDLFPALLKEATVKGYVYSA